MRTNCNRRTFIRDATLGTFALTFTGGLSSPKWENGLLESRHPGIATGEGYRFHQKPEFDWLNHARIFIIDGYTYPLTPKLEFDAVKLADTMVDMHANVLRIATSGYCDCLIQGTDFKLADDLGTRDILAECIAACRPHGIKVIPYLRTGAPLKTSSVKTEWAQKINRKGDILSSWDLGEKVTAVCWNTPYRQAFYRYVKILMSNYDIDGIYFDSWSPFYGYKGHNCFCEGCMKGFKKFSGNDLPYRENADEYTSEELQIISDYREWYTGELFEVFSETKRIVKSHQDIPLIYNMNNPSNMSGRYQHQISIMNESDAFLYERGKSMIERAEGVSLATTHGMTVWPYVGTYDPYPRIPHFKYELGQEIFTTVAFGGSPTLYHTYFFTDHPHRREPVKEAFKIIDKNDESFRGFLSDKFCAVVWNDSDPPGHAFERYLWSGNARLSSLGSFSACIKNHIQVSSFLKTDLDNPEILNAFKVLYLSDICHLTDSQIAGIKRFVKKGGGLVMTYATSLYDENGDRRSNFALSDLGKMRYHGPDEEMSERIKRHSTFGGVWDLYLKARKGQEVIKSPLSGGLIPTHVYETIDVLPGGTIIADLVSGHEKEPIAPGLIVSQYGKGKVAYIASCLGAMYQQTGIKEFSDFIRDVIDYVSPEGVPYEIDAPHGTFITNMMVNGDKRVFHLVNWSGNQSERMWQNVYHIPAIENITIKLNIPAGKRINKITSFIPVDLLQKQEKDILNITLPRVEKYQGIVVEMI